MKKLGFIGGGNMAEALMRGLVGNGVFTPADLIASDVDAARRQKIKRGLKIDATADNAEVLRNSRALLIAVKPQNIGEVLDGLAAAMRPADGITNGGPRKAVQRPVALKDRLFISIAAGITIARFIDALGRDARVIRVMPNAPAMVGQGMAALVRAPGASRNDEAFALRIFRAVGDAVALGDETQLDAVTALSGSGPAYVYLFVKAMADAAVAEGLPRELAIRMALKTIRGAEENMRQSPLDAAELIRIVASPGGTTEAALKKFAARGFSDIVAGALHAAAERSRELGRP
jgi:pyrroline-5-carboxylate reductase